MTFIYWIHHQNHTNLFKEGYIGVTNHLAKRFREHKNTKINPHLLNAFKTYNDNIIQTILLKGDENYCYEIETKLRPKDHIGWNICPGGNKPPTGYGNKNNFYGKKHSKFSKEKNRLAHIGKSHSLNENQREEIRQRMAKTYIVTDPIGNQQIVNNLKKFAELNSLQESNMRKKCGSKGWKAKLLT